MLAHPGLFLRPSDLGSAQIASPQPTLEVRRDRRLAMITLPARRPSRLDRTRLRGGFPHGHDWRRLQPLQRLTDRPHGLLPREARLPVSDLLDRDEADTGLASETGVIAEAKYGPLEFLVYFRETGFDLLTQCALLQAVETTNSVLSLHINK